MGQRGFECSRIAATRKTDTAMVSSLKQITITNYFLKVMSVVWKNKIK
jgi:hypothetical protein